MNLVEQIREKLDIAKFVAPHTNGLKPSGKGFLIGRCPFHQSPDDPPSKRKFWVNVEKKICGCFVQDCQAHAPKLSACRKLCFQGK